MQKLHLIQDAAQAAQSATNILFTTQELRWPQGASVENLGFARARLIEALANIEAVLQLGDSLTDTITRNERDAFVDELAPAVRQAATLIATK